jgi:ketosteroid isomerase-like protein
MTGSIEQEILTEEENLTQAKRRLDISALDRLYADDVMFTGATGEVCGKAAMMAEAARGVSERNNAASQGKKFSTSIDKEDIKIVAHGDTAIASYRFIVRVQGDGIDVHRRYRTTDVWLQRGGQWQVIGGHLSSLDAQGAR